MTASKELIGTRPFKYRYLLLIAVPLCIYVMENLTMLTFTKGTLFTYFIKPLLWVGVAYIIWLLPRVRAKGPLRLRRLINWWAVNCAVFYILLMVICGMIEGFGRSPYNQTPLGILMNLFFLSAVLIGEESVRAFLINHSTRKYPLLMIGVIALFMTLLSLSFNRLIALRTSIDIMKYIGEYFLPSFSNHLLVSYLAYLGGVVPAVIYLGILQALHWFSPILPDLGLISKALVGTLCPIFSLMFIQSLYVREAREARKEISKESPVGWSVTSIVSIGIIWFTVGLFPVHPCVIATGSMKPMIDPGDIILVKKTDQTEIQQGDVVQIKRQNFYIFHRIIDAKEEKDGVKYLTKGDNNTAPDTELVRPEEIKGKVIYVIPKIGWPTLLLKDQNTVAVGEVEF